MAQNNWPILIFFTIVVSQVEIIPSGTVVSAPGQDLSFQCSPSGGESFTNVEWVLNGSRIETFHLTNIEMAFFSSVGLGLLRFTSLTAELNSSHIRCIAYLASGSGPLSSSVTLLLLQGQLSSVADLTLHVNATSETVVITWRPPFSLDVMENLTYCVEVTNGTSLESLQMGCNVTETKFEFSLPPMSWCGIIIFTITPVNLAGRGSSSETVYVPELNAPEIDEVQCALVEDGSTRIYNYTLLMTFPVCNAEVSIFDGGFVIHPSITIGRNFITFASHQLDLDGVYSVLVRAENFHGSALSQTTIRTNDITAIEMRVSGDKLEYQVSFCENSKAVGILSCLLFLTEDETVDFSKSPLQALDRTQSSNHTIVLDFDGEYTMLVYNLLHDGTLASGTSSPAVMDTFSVNRTNNVGSTPHLSIQCSVNSSLLLLLVKCVVSNDTVTSLQVIAQSIETADDVGTLYTNRSSDPQATVTVQVERSGRHQVIVFPISGGRGILDVTAKFQMEVMVEERPLQGTTTIDDTTTVDTHIVDTAGPSAGTTGPSAGTTGPSAGAASTGIVVSVSVILVVVVVIMVVVAMMTVLLKIRKRQYFSTVRYASEEGNIYFKSPDSESPQTKQTVSSHSAHTTEETLFLSRHRNAEQDDDALPPLSYENVPFTSSYAPPPSEDIIPSSSKEYDVQQEAQSVNIVTDFPLPRVETGVSRRNPVTLDTPGGDQGILAYNLEAHCMYYVEANVEDKVLSVAQNGDKDFRSLTMNAELSKKTRAQSLCSLPQQVTGTSEKTLLVPSFPSPIKPN